MNCKIGRMAEVDRDGAKLYLGHEVGTASQVSNQLAIIFFSNASLTSLLLREIGVLNLFVDR
jgi:hypothetical protein